MHNQIQHIYPIQLQAILLGQNPPLILDVREKEELEICVMPKYIHIPLGNLVQELIFLSNTRQIVTVCHHGRRSLQAAYILIDNGFNNVLNLAGGINAWAKDVDSNMQQY